MCVYFVCVCVCVCVSWQKKAVLADTKLPEEFRVALATVVDHDLFAKAIMHIGRYINAIMHARRYIRRYKEAIYKLIGSIIHSRTFN